MQREEGSAPMLLVFFTYPLPTPTASTHPPAALGAYTTSQPHYLVYMDFYMDFIYFPVLWYWGISHALINLAPQHL